MVEQGLSFTVIETPHPLESNASRFDPRRDFYSARRIWLGWTGGTDWLHDALEAELGEEGPWYDVQSRRDATHVGAAGETAAVILILMGTGAATAFATKFGGTLGERSAETLFDWVRGRTAERRRIKGWEEFDDAPNFDEYDGEALARGMTGELADLLRIPEERLTLVSHSTREGVAVDALYRDAASREQYTAEVGSNEAVFRRVGAPEPPTEVSSG